MTPTKIVPKKKQSKRVRISTNGKEDHKPAKKVEQKKIFTYYEHLQALSSPLQEGQLTFTEEKNKSLRAIEKKTLTFN